MGCWGFLGLVGDAGYQVVLREALLMSFLAEEQWLYLQGNPLPPTETHKLEGRLQPGRLCPWTLTPCLALPGPGLGHIQPFATKQRPSLKTQSLPCPLTWPPQPLTHLHVFLLHGLVVGRVLSQVPVGGAEVVDVTSAGLHAAGVVHETGQLPGGQGRGLVSQQLRNVLLKTDKGPGSESLQSSWTQLGSLWLEGGEALLASHPAGGPTVFYSREGPLEAWLRLQATGLSWCPAGPTSNEQGVSESTFHPGWPRASRSRASWASCAPQEWPDPL